MVAHTSVVMSITAVIIAVMIMSYTMATVFSTTYWTMLIRQATGLRRRRWRGDSGDHLLLQRDVSTCVSSNRYDVVRTCGRRCRQCWAAK